MTRGWAGIRPDTGDEIHNVLLAKMPKGAGNFDNGAGFRNEVRGELQWFGIEHHNGAQHVGGVVVRFLDDLREVHRGQFIGAVADSLLVIERSIEIVAIRIEDGDERAWIIAFELTGYFHNGGWQLVHDVTCLGGYSSFIIARRGVVYAFLVRVLDVSALMAW